MKTRSIQTLLLAATLGLLVTACNNDSDQTVDITKPINVKLSLTTTGTNIPISRAAIGATEFDDDDALGLYIAHKTGANDESPISASLDPKNTKWVNGSFTDEPLYWQNVTDQHTLYAYYPYTNTATDTYTVPNVSIKPDQNNSSTAAAFTAAGDLPCRFPSARATVSRPSISMVTFRPSSPILTAVLTFPISLALSFPWSCGIHRFPRRTSVSGRSASCPASAVFPASASVRIPPAFRG